MSRLEEHRRKQYRNKLILFIGIIFLLIFLLFQYGFKALINSSLFLNNLTGGTKDNDNAKDQNSDFFGTLDFFEPPSATNSAKIVVSGSATGFDSLEFYINDTKVLDRKLVTESFSEEIGDLKEGDNKIHVKAVAKKEKKTEKSTVYTVAFKKEKPKLEISEPQNDTTTDKNDITVAGGTDKEVTIRINGSPVVVDAQGNFRSSVRLKDGENKIMITAQDEAGNSDSKELTIRYEND